MPPGARGTWRRWSRARQEPAPSSRPTRARPCSRRRQGGRWRCSGGLRSRSCSNRESTDWWNRIRLAGIRARTADRWSVPRTNGRRFRRPPAARRSRASKRDDVSWLISLVVEIGRRQQEGVPFLLRVGARQGVLGARAEKWFYRLVVQTVGELRESAAGGAAVLRVEQAGVAGADGTRDLESAAHLTGTRPGE